MRIESEKVDLDDIRTSITVDSKDITSFCTYLDYTFKCNNDFSLENGSHKIKFVFYDISGNKYEYFWMFNIEASMNASSSNVLGVSDLSPANTVITNILFVLFIVFVLIVLLIMVPWIIYFISYMKSNETYVK